MLGTPLGAEGAMTKEVKLCDSEVLVLVVGAFADLSSVVDALADVIAAGGPHDPVPAS